MAKKADNAVWLVETTQGPHQRGVFSLVELNQADVVRLFGPSVFRLALPQDQVAELTRRLNREHEGEADELLADAPAQD